MHPVVYNKLQLNNKITREMMERLLKNRECREHIATTDSGNVTVRSH